MGDDRPTLVSRTAYERAGEPKEAWRLVLDVVDHVNALREGLFHVDEIPRRAWGVYFADYYLAQVRNGGHSQYIHNARDLAAMSRSALDALDEMGAEALAAILREMLDWARAHPEEAGRQNGFEVRAPALDALDARFYAVNDGAPMSVASARWIAGWPDLKVIEDAGWRPPAPR
ncbi:MAG: DUF4375 domain-containing protein [Rhodoblastus sp.]|nr:MAG: DUF4375 domain-containing protein [Rhodoblastus sp.]